jgi:hypothetical protein
MNAPKQRKNERINFWGTIEYVYENSECSFGAEVYNYSDSGACIETGYEIRPGSKIVFQMEENQHDMSCPNIKHGRIAKVKWCKTPPGHKAFCYWVGVEFIENR